MDASEFAPYVALVGSLVVAGVAFFNSDRQIRVQRRELSQAANREIGYETVSWLSAAGQDIGQWYGARAQRQLTTPHRGEAEERARKTHDHGRRVSAKVGLLFGPSAEVTKLLDLAIRRYAEIAYLTKRGLPVAGDRPIDTALGEWEQIVRELYDALAVQAGRPQAAGWVGAKAEPREVPDHDSLEEWL